MKPQLLTVSDLPNGWSVDNSSDDSSGAAAPPCLKDLKAKLHTAARAEADFARSDVPSLQQIIGAYATARTALAKFKTATHILDGCTDVSFENDGHKFTGSIGRLSFPNLGMHSAAWRIGYSGEGVRLEIDVVLVNKGTELEELTYFDLGSVDLDEFTPLARKAVAKMPAK